MFNSQKNTPLTVTGVFRGVDVPFVALVTGTVSVVSALYLYTARVGAAVLIVTTRYL